MHKWFRLATFVSTVQGNEALTENPKSMENLKKIVEDAILSVRKDHVESLPNEEGGGLCGHTTANKYLFDLKDMFFDEKLDIFYNVYDELLGHNANGAYYEKRARIVYANNEGLVYYTTFRWFKKEEVRSLNGMDKNVLRNNGNAYEVVYANKNSIKIKEFALKLFNEA